MKLIKTNCKFERLLNSFNLNTKFYKAFFLLLTGITLTLDLNAQNIKISGKVFEKSSMQALAGVSVGIKLNGKIIGGSATNENGLFTIEVNKPDTYQLYFSYIGLKAKEQTVYVIADKYIGAVFLSKDEKALNEVIIEGSQTRVEQKGDTTSINASAFKVNQDATTEDLVKKMPGITVENGTVKAQGEDIKKVLLDGKEFFGDDASIALKNLPAEIVDKVQIFNRLGDQAQFTGFNDGNTDKTLNIVTKPGRSNGTFGKFYAGYGTNNRYQSGVTLNLFKGNQRITILGISNNINQQNFSMQDIFGGGGGAPRGGGMGRGGAGGGTDLSGFMVGQQTGISNTNSIGINYADKWGTKTQLSGSYFYNNSKSVTEKTLQRHYLLNPGLNQLYDDSTSTTTSNYNNRFNLRLEHTIDSFNSVIFTPKVSFQDNESNSYTLGSNYLHNSIINSSITSKESTNKGFTYNSNLLLRHKFLKLGRTISFNLGNDYNQKNNQTDQNSINSVYDSLGSANVNRFLQRSITKTAGNSISGTLTYTEPINKKSQLLFSYSYAYTNNLADKSTHLYDSITNEYDSINIQLSNKFNNKIITQKANVGYNYNGDKYSFNLGLSPQIVQLNSVQTYPHELNFDKSFFNVLPNAMYTYKFSNNKTLRTFYRTNTNTPSVTQLQNVVDNSNPFLLSAGNASLKQEFSHTAMVRYGANNVQNAQSFFVFAMGSLTNNAISNATYTASKDTLIQNGVTLKKGSQLTYPVNIDKNLSLRTFATYGLPIKKLKSNLNINTGINYTSVPGLINYKTNYANTFNITSGFVLGSNISQQVDFTITHNANINLVKNTIQSQTTSNYFINTSGLKANIMPLKSLMISTDLSYTNYKGLGSTFNQSFLLWNAGIAYKFLKNNAAEIKLSVFDMLKQNNSISRSVTETYIEDSKSNVLQRYFMLTFTYNIRKFNGMVMPPQSNPRQGMEMMMPPMMPHRN